jgi:hypothetical protein
VTRHRVWSLGAESSGWFQRLSGRRRSRVEHRRLDRLASSGVGLFWFGTLLGPEGTAVWLFSSVPDHSAFSYRVLTGCLVGAGLGGEPVGV